MRKLAPVLAIATTALGAAALPALAHCPGCGGAGGGGGWGGAVAKQWGVSARAFSNQGGNANVYTMLGLEMRRVYDDGHSAGFAFYRGLNLGDQTNVDATSLGGLVLGREFGMGPVILGGGVLLGGGCILTASPTLTFSNFGAFFAAEPRVSLGLALGEVHRLTLSAGYLATTRMSQVSGPALTLTWSARGPARRLRRGDL